MLSFTSLAATIAEADAYALARGWSNWTGTDPVKTAALRRGQDFIAGTYNSRWLDEWENADAPENVKFAIIEAARRELVKPGSMSPDMKRGGAIKSVGAGSARVEWKDSAPTGTTFKAIDNLLRPFLAAATGASVDLLRV